MKSTAKNQGKINFRTDGRSGRKTMTTTTLEYGEVEQDIQSIIEDLEGQGYERHVAMDEWTLTYTKDSKRVSFNDKNREIEIDAEYQDIESLLEGEY